MTKCHELSGLQQLQSIFSESEARLPRPVSAGPRSLPELPGAAGRHWHAWAGRFLTPTSASITAWLCRVSAGLSSHCMCTSVFSSPSKNSSQIGSNAHPITVVPFLNLHLNFTCKDPISKDVHVHRSQGLGF